MKPIWDLPLENIEDTYMMVAKNMIELVNKTELISH
jgi:hypothetical protein